MKETDLVKRAQAGDFEAFTILVNAHKEKIYALARRLSGSIEDAEDIVQETLLKAIDKIDQFRVESSFGTWLYAIALNQARATLARNKQYELKPIDDYLPSKKSSESHSDQAVFFDWKDPAHLMESDELRKLIDEAIKTLPYKYREPFILRYIEEMSVKEVASSIRQSEAATKSRILRARLALRDYLSERFEVEQ